MKTHHNAKPYMPFYAFYGSKHNNELKCPFMPFMVQDTATNSNALLCLLWFKTQRQT